MQEKFAEDPDALKSLRRFRSAFPDEKPAGDAMKLANPDVKGRLLFFKKIGERWFVENRQTEEKGAGAGKGVGARPTRQAAQDS